MDIIFVVFALNDAVTRTMQELGVDSPTSRLMSPLNLEAYGLRDFQCGQSAYAPDCYALYRSSVARSIIVDGGNGHWREPV